MKIVLLTKERKALFKNGDAKKTDWEFRQAVYVLTPDRIQNFVNKYGMVAGSEIIFFENNPTGVSGKVEQEDKSSAYLDGVVLVNFIQQTTDTFGKWNLPSFNLKWFIETPSRLPVLLMVGMIIWALFKEAIVGFLGLLI